MSDKLTNNSDMNNTKEVCKDVCETGEKKEDFSMKKEIMTLGLGILIYAGALVFKLPFWLGLSLFLLSYIIIAGDIVWKAIRNVFRREVFDENFLLTVATAGAFAIKKFPEAVAVMLFFKIGELLQDIALNRSRKSIKSLMEIRPDYANLKIDGETKKVDPDGVNVGDVIMVKPGERVPLDGIVLDGSSLVDTSALTGESVPRKVKAKDEILSGMINKTGLLTVQVAKRFSESTVSKILDLVENAASRKAPTEKFITKFAKYYTPAVVFGAFSLAIVPVMLYHIPAFTPMFAHEETFSEWIYKALIFLVISCPCALVISIPLGFFGGIGAASKRGVLVKGSNYLEGLNNLHTIVWDKTGTLTKGVFRVTKIVTKNKFSEDKILKFAAHAESQSSHPIAQSILEAFNRKIDVRKIESYEEISGYGIKARVEGHYVLVGNDKLLHKENIEHDTCDVSGTVVHVVIDHKYAGYAIISDEIKEDARTTLQKLRDIGVKRQIMLTGDSQEVAKAVSQKLGLDEYFAELLPQQKVEKIEELMKKKANNKDLIAFVGDGINDAPVLMRSDIGVAMGALGSDAAIEAADIVLMSDELSKLYEAVKIAKRTRGIVWQNIGFALGIKGIFLAIGALGMATMWEAVFADVGVALLAILNTTRILK
ncbi:MAG: heavy metal translocating P-type ATPase [Methanophagales archaeon]|nr:heavy metal translocating P-type ATPase [Methanophagales archaeon]